LTWAIIKNRNGESRNYLGEFEQGQAGEQVDFVAFDFDDRAGLGRGYVEARGLWLWFGNGNVAMVLL
jgi:hypothetical protein